MAITLDKQNIGTATGDPGSTTIAFTTSQAVVSSGFIILTVGWFDNGATLTGVADNNGTPLTWTIDKQGKGAVSNSQNSAVVSAQAPSGLASGKIITATFSASVIAREIGGTSFTGVATSTPVEATDGPVTIDGTPSSTYTTNSVAISAGSMLFAATYNETTNTTSTPATGCTEAIDLNYAGGTTLTSNYRIEASAGSYTVGGTWASGACKSVTNAVAYLAAGGGGGGATVPATRELVVPSFAVNRSSYY